MLRPFASSISLHDAAALVKDAQLRAWLGLALRYGKRPRYQPLMLKAMGYQWQVPDALSFLHQLREIMVRQRYKFTSQRPAPRILDGGANVGTATLYWKRLYPQAHITAYEADPSIAAYLRSNLTANGITDVRVEEKALWINTGLVSFAPEGGDAGSISPEGTGRVPTLRLRDVLENAGPVDMLKLDIEGAEASVLPDCKGALAQVQHLIVEVHSYLGKPQPLGQILTLLSAEGFRYYLISPPNPKREPPLMNTSPLIAMDMNVDVYAWR